MTKQDFVDAVADRAGMSKRDAGVAVDAVLDTITSALTNGDAVTFTGFGKFSTSARAARMGVNPRTGAKVMIPAFALGTTMLRRVRRLPAPSMRAASRSSFGTLRIVEASRKMPNGRLRLT